MSQKYYSVFMMFIRLIEPEKLRMLVVDAADKEHTILQALSVHEEEVPESCTRFAAQ